MYTPRVELKNKTKLSYNKDENSPTFKIVVTDGLSFVAAAQATVVRLFLRQHFGAFIPTTMRLNFGNRNCAKTRFRTGCHHPMGERPRPPPAESETVGKVTNVQESAVRKVYVTSSCLED